jgi:antibiotic biosynthesis monooxygenase (ABM) superfamily enzyme
MSNSAYLAEPKASDWYIYYQVRIDDAANLQTRISTMQRSLLLETGVIGSLKRRPAAENGLHTWMEVYPAAPNTFIQLLTDAVQSYNLQELIDGERHAEQFWDLTSCA